MKWYNKLYGVLTNENIGYRSTNYVSVPVSDYIAKIISTLIPASSNSEEKAHRAELFIKLASTDYDCVELIQQKDPYNSYAVVSYDIELDHSYDLNTIGDNIKALQLKGTERDFGPVELIINAVKNILENL